MADIFVCYRRKDSAGHAGRLVRDLAAKFPGSKIFHDMDSLQAGVPFRTAINDALDSSEVLLAVIGPHWRNSIHRLENPKDYVRVEIETGLKSDALVIPVLVGGAEVPTRQELPEAIADLAGRQVHEITDSRWDYDVKELAEDLSRLPGLSGVRGRLRSLIAGVSAWLYAPLALFAILVLLAGITRATTGVEFDGPPPGLRPLSVSLLQEGVDERDRGCIKPLDCGSQRMAGNRVSEDVRLLTADVSVDVEQRELHLLLGVSWTFREGKTNIAHRGYTGDVYLVAEYAREVGGDRIAASRFQYRADSLGPYNGLIAFVLGWYDVRSIRDRKNILIPVIKHRINQAPQLQTLLET